MMSGVVHRVVVGGLAVLGTFLLAVSLADMRGLNGRLASATAQPVPVQQVDRPSRDCPNRTHQRVQRSWQKT
jgi:hypothetical protein